MPKTVNFARSSKKHAARDQLVKVVRKVTVIGTVVYVVVFVGVFGVGIYLQLRLRAIQSKVAERIEQIESYREIETMLFGAKKRLGIIRQLREQPGEGLAAGIDRAVAFIKGRSVVSSLAVNKHGQETEIIMSDSDLAEIMDIFEDVVFLPAAEGGYNSAAMVQISKGEDGVYSYGFRLEVDDNE